MIHIDTLSLQLLRHQAQLNMLNINTDTFCYNRYIKLLLFY